MSFGQFFKVGFGIGLQKKKKENEQLLFNLVSA